MPRILCLGEISHWVDFSSFRFILKDILQEVDPDLVICFVDKILESEGNVAFLFEKLFDSGIDVVVCGLKIVGRASTRRALEKGFPVVCPLNLPSFSPGRKSVSSQKLAGNAEGGKRPTAGDEGCEVRAQSLAPVLHPEGGRVPPFIEKLRKSIFVKIAGIEVGVVSLAFGGGSCPTDDPFSTFENWLNVENPGDLPIIAFLTGNPIGEKKAFMWYFSSRQKIIHGLGVGNGFLAHHGIVSQARLFFPDIGQVGVERAIDGRTPEDWWNLRRNLRKGTQDIPEGELIFSGVQLEVDEKLGLVKNSVIHRGLNRAAH